MTVKPTQVVVGIAGLAIGVLGVLSLREATLSTHGRVDPDSRVELVLHAETHRPEPRQTLPEMVEAQLQTCRLEVTSDLDGPIESLGEGRFRAVLTPAMDETNRRQFRGCVEDFMIDHVQIDVIQLTVVR